MLTMGRGKRALGMCLGERSLVAAEIFTNGKSPSVARSIEFTYPDGLSFQKPTELGRVLRRFLADNKFEARRTVLGIPARWLVVRRCQVPPTDSQSAAQLIWLDATEHTSRELGEVVYDYAGQTSEVESRVVLALGLQKSWIDRLEEICEPAGLEIAAITPTSIAAAAASNVGQDDALILSVCRQAAELVIIEKGQLHSIRHIGTPRPLSALIAQLRRADADRNLAIGKAILWERDIPDPELAAAFEEFAARPINAARASWLQIADASLTAAPLCLPASALTLPLRNDSQFDIDFLHPRLSPPAHIPVRRWRQWATAAALVTLIVALCAYLDVSHLDGQIADQDRILQSLQPALAIARPFVESMQFASSYSSARPNYISCLRDLTQAVPEGGKTYFISFDLDDTMHGAIAGRSASEQEIISFLDRLSSSGHFVDFHRTLDAHSNKNRGNEVVFSVNFTYRPSS